MIVIITFMSTTDSFPEASVEIELTNGLKTLLDRSDAAQFEGKSLFYNKRTRYAYATATVNGVRNNFAIHQIIMRPPAGMYTDHINGDRLDNRRSNLRFVTPGQNRTNSAAKRTNASGYKGVVRSQFDDRWVAKIYPDSKPLVIGYFDNPVDAARAYDSKAKELYGEFARTNF